MFSQLLNFMTSHLILSQKLIMMDTLVREGVSHKEILSANMHLFYDFLLGVRESFIRPNLQIKVHESNDQSDNDQRLSNISEGVLENITNSNTCNQQTVKSLVR